MPDVQGSNGGNVYDPRTGSAEHYWKSVQQNLNEVQAQAKKNNMSVYNRIHGLRAIANPVVYPATYPPAKRDQYK